MNECSGFRFRVFRPWFSLALLWSFLVCQLYVHFDYIQHLLLSDTHCLPFQALFIIPYNLSKHSQHRRIWFLANQRISYFHSTPLRKNDNTTHTEIRTNTKFIVLLCVFCPNATINCHSISVVHSICLLAWNQKWLFCTYLFVYSLQMTIFSWIVCSPFRNFSYTIFNSS